MVKEFVNHLVPKQSPTPRAVATHVVDQVAETAKGEDEEVNLLDELPFSGLILYMEVLAKS